MLQKLIDLVKNNLHKLNPNCKIKLPMTLIYIFVFVIVLVFSLFIGGWVYNLKATDIADLNILLELFEIMFSGATLAAILGYGKLLIDKNSNGIPDELENPSEEISSEINETKG